VIHTNRKFSLASNAATVLAQVRSVPQLQLEQETDSVTTVVFRGRTIAHVDGGQQSAEIVVPAVELDQVLAEHRDVERGPIGVTVNLTSPSCVQTAVALICRGVDEAVYRGQLRSSNP
jgi:hypothetical protein